MKFFEQPKNLQILSVLMALVGLLDSFYLWYTKVANNQFICGIEGCDIVNASQFSVLLGIPVAAIGAGGYAALLALALYALVVKDNAPTWLTNARFLLASGGLFFAGYLTVLEVLVIHAI